MTRFSLRRLAVGILVALTVVVLSFMLTRLSGDLAISIAGPQATQTDIEIIRKAYGLDRPLYVQFGNWIGRAAVGDFGESYFFKDKVSNLIARRMPITMTLGLIGLGLALVMSIPLGILAAVREGSWVDRTVTLFTMIGQAMPSFWLGLILMIVFGLQLGWLPISGIESWQSFVMPGVVLAFTAVPALTRLTRSGMMEALSSDYVRTARAKGLLRSSIIFKHALRNAAIPVVSIAAVQLGFMLGGSIVIETVFALHGVGYLGWESIAKNDFPVVQAVVLVLAVFYIGLTLLADILNALLDPRRHRMSDTITIRPRSVSSASQCRVLPSPRHLRPRVLMALLSNLVPHDPWTQNLNNRLIPPLLYEGGGTSPSAWHRSDRPYTTLVTARISL